jgi:glutathione S-transferase
MNLLFPLLSFFAMTPLPKIKLTYFDIEGVAEAVRLALVLSNTPFEDDRVGFGDWGEMKPKTPYGCLPIMSVDDGPLRTQSMAMLRWVGSSCSETLYPRGKIFDIEEAIGLMEDLNKSWYPAFAIGMRPQNYGRPEGFGQTEEGKKIIKEMRETWFQNELPRFLTYIENKLERNQWLAGGETPTIADCVAVPILRNFSRGHVDHVPATALDSHPKVVDYIKRFCAQPQLKGRYNNGIH